MIWMRGLPSLPSAAPMQLQFAAGMAQKSRRQVEPQGGHRVAVRAGRRQRQGQPLPESRLAVPQQGTQQQADGQQYAPHVHGSGRGREQLSQPLQLQLADEAAERVALQRQPHRLRAVDGREFGQGGQKRESPVRGVHARPGMADDRHRAARRRRRSSAVAAGRRRASSADLRSAGPCHSKPIDPASRSAGSACVGWLPRAGRDVAVDPALPTTAQDFMPDLPAFACVFEQG